MACGVELSFAIFVVLFVLKLPILICGVQQVPCYFVFGDSSVDNGNNNQLKTQAKSNYLPYGIDFRDGPTGRFTNGRNNADILAELLGFDDYIPPFATARGTNILKGVNYASGGAGIRAETGQNLGDRISLDTQLINHRTTISRIASLQGNKNSTKEYLKKCIYTVAMGSNDYINNYLMPNSYTSSRQYTPDRYAAALIQQYSNQLTTLYSYGARKVAVFGLGAIGYIPEQVANFGTNGSTYSEVIDNEVQLFNDRLKPLIDELNKKLANAHFIYVNLTSILSAGYLSSNIGFNVITHAPCCMVSTNIAKGQCVPNQIPCDNRNEYLFLDGYHPTELVNLVLASRSYIALTPFDAYPFDISTLALI